MFNTRTAFTKQLTPRNSWILLIKSTIRLPGRKCLFLVKLFTTVKGNEPGCFLQQLPYTNHSSLVADVFTPPSITSKNMLHVKISTSCLILVTDFEIMTLTARYN